MKNTLPNGKVFRSNSGEEYGPIRSVQGKLPNELLKSPIYEAIAEDSCGNYFISNGTNISFWDHETTYITLLASSFPEFLANCVEPSETELKAGQVESVWIDPEFAKEMGLDKKP